MSEADSPHDTQSVLGKPLIRVSYAAEAFLPQILRPSKAVNDSGIWMISQRIDGKIPAGKILFEAAGKADRVRMPAVAVTAILFGRW